WLARRAALAAVEIERRVGREHRIVSGGGRRDRALHAAPGHDRGIGGHAALEDLVPADEAPAVRTQVLSHAVSEVALQRILARHPELAHALVHPRGGLPLVLDRLIAPHVDELPRKALHDFGEPVREKREGGFLPGAG